jgi:uncharacterized protein YqhQ
VSKELMRLGGMALRNGLLIHGPTSWAAAARDESGEIRVASGPKPVFAPGAAERIPGLRGPLRLLEGFAVVPIVRRELPAARLPFEDARVVAAMVAGTVGSSLLRRLRPSMLREAGVAALGLAPAMLALRDPELTAYHGVEHKAIGAYERGSDDPGSANKEHDRCGSHLIAPMVVLSGAGQLILERLVDEPGPVARATVGMASVSAAVEVFAWAERNSESAAAEALRRPGTEIQRLVATREPTDEQLEVGTAALEEILRAEGAAAAV